MLYSWTQNLNLDKVQVLLQENIRKKDISKNGKLENQSLKKLSRKRKQEEQNLSSQSITLKRVHNSKKQIIKQTKKFKKINKETKQLKDNKN